MPSQRLCSHSSGKSNPMLSPVIHDDCHPTMSGSCRVTQAPWKARRGAEALRVKQMMIAWRQWKRIQRKVVWPWGLVSAGHFEVWISGCLNGSSCQAFPNHRCLPATLDRTPWLESSWLGKDCLWELTVYFYYLQIAVKTFPTAIPINSKFSIFSLEVY